MHTYSENKKRVDKFNHDNAGTSRYKMALNDYADLTSEQFDELFHFEDNRRIFAEAIA